MNATKPSIIRVNDLTLAAYLNLHGCVHSSCELQGQKCLWVFPASATVQSHIDDYNMRQANVDDVPSLISTYMDVRKEMFDFLNRNGITHARPRQG